MTKIEKAEAIIRQYGACHGVSCDTTKNNECVCFEWCKKINTATNCRRGCLEICEKYLKENAMEKQVFDKSKVLVAGLHDIEADKQYIVSNYVSELERKVKGEVSYQARNLITCGDKYKSANHSLWQFAYPYEEPVKTWRPIKTIEEVERFLGKKIKSKDGRKMMIISDCYLDDDMFLNRLSAKYVFEGYTMEDGSPVGIEVNDD